MFGLRAIRDTAEHAASYYAATVNQTTAYPMLTERAYRPATPYYEDVAPLCVGRSPTWQRPQ